MKNLDSLNNNQPSVRATSRIVPSPQLSSSLQLRQKKSGTLVKIIFTVILLAIAVVGFFLVTRTIQLSNRIFVGQKTTFFGKVKQIFQGLAGTTTLQGEDLGQVNILLLGIGGEGHDGPYLSDTIILAQIRPDIGEVVLTSIPRDYLVSLKGLGDRKINAAFAENFARNKDWNEAGKYTREVVEKISGLSIPYFAVLDFAGFEKAVDQLGGIDVYVERTFTDYQYPNDKYGYLPALTFQQGWEHMNGERSLQFARSRHAAPPEGSDFARSQRQQKVIQATKDKALKLNLVTESGTINKLVGTFADHFHTNMNPAEMYRIYKLVQENKIDKFLSVSLDPETGLICDAVYENVGYVLVPCAGNTENDVQNFFKNSFALGKMAQEKSVVWLGTSTTNQSALRYVKSSLEKAGITVYEINYSNDSLPKNIFFQVNQKPATSEFLKNSFGAEEVVIAPPGVRIDPAKSDIILILGENQKVPKIIVPPPSTTPPPAAATSAKPSTATTTKATTTNR